MWNSRSHWSQMIMVRSPKPPRRKSGLVHSTQPPWLAASPATVISSGSIFPRLRLHWQPSDLPSSAICDDVSVHRLRGSCDAESSRPDTLPAQPL